MGVPKFYRWLSERYPCLSQVIKEHQIPEFDNLYLDMNGIIHPCSHPNDDDPHFRITEAEIFKNVFNYIEVLFRIIKPKKNFFMAVDGCAPRAKMNQQRSRRFRTAKEAENNIRKAQMKGQVLPKEDRFDSNCITPGTEFMARLQNQLQYFVNMKISSDPLWQECTVYLSGHDVPGEGEHKIMDFIRYCKAQPGYDPNTRHCLYGLDADLIMLGLTSHEPHFALLREEVRFGKKSKRITKAEQQTFHLLHLSLLREYLEFEFGVLKEKINFDFDIEQIIDDWILLGFLVGNDFVPNLPNFHINHDALPYLFGVYKDFLLTSDGYLHNGGNINLHRLKKFFQFLSKFDLNNFEEKYEDSKWLESKRTGQMLKSSRKEDNRDYRYKNSDNDPLNSLATIASGDFDNELIKGVPKIEDLTDEEAFELEFKQYKRSYYIEKFKMPAVDEEDIQKICYEYVLALQWIAHYYFNGLQSWSWYYPYHYSPFISDVANFNIEELHFDMGNPFKPFEQLLAVLPSASRKLLPRAFQTLMIMDTSPIIDYYPPDFQTDLNGKQQEWEAVVLIPFIDENRLLNAMERHYESLTDEEKFRNNFGRCLKYEYNSTLTFSYPSSYPGVFEDIRRCKVKKDTLDRTHFHLHPKYLKKGLMEGTKLDVYFPGFPTMRHLKHTTYLKKAGVRVFQYNSRSENMIVKVKEFESKDIEDLAKKIVGKNVHVDWPYLVEAKVISVANEEVKFFAGGKNNSLQSELIRQESYNEFVREMKDVCTFLKTRKGIEVGQSDVIVETKLLLGKRHICKADGSVRTEKEYSRTPSFYPSKIVVKNLAVQASSQKEFTNIETLYPVGSTCFMMASSYYGCAAEVIEIDKESNKVRLAFTIPKELNFQTIVKDYDQLSVSYLTEYAVSQKLGISVFVLNRITGDLMVNENHETSSRVNIGLKIKYTGQKKEAVGFARLFNNSWTYSSVTVDVLKDYINKFPEVFETISSSNNDGFVLADFSKKKSFLQDVQGFLKTLPCYKAETVRCGSNVLDKPVIDRIHEEIESLKLAQNLEIEKQKSTKAKVKPNCIFRPTDQFGKLSPDPDTTFLLFDRVVNVDKGITVPLGFRGTIVGIHKVPIDENDRNSPLETRYEVLFDENFLGASNVRTIDGHGYYMCGYSLINISHGERLVSNKAGDKPSDFTTFQNLITYPNSDDKGKHSTRGRREHGRPGPKSDVQEHWLKGKYQSPNHKGSPQQNHHSPHQKAGGFKSQDEYQHRSIKSRSSNTGGSLFMSILKELKKEEENQSQTSSSMHNVDQNATDTIQKMLKMNQKSSPKQRNSQPLQQDIRSQSPVQVLKRQPQHIYQPPTPLSQNQGIRNPPMQMRSVPPFMQPTMVLLQCCNQMNLPQPQFMFAKHQQGFQAFVSVGQRQFSGTIFPTEQAAIENVAMIAFCHLTGFQPTFPNQQNQVNNHQHLQQAPPGQREHQNQSPRNQYSGNNRDRYQKNIKQSQSDTAFDKRNQAPSKANPFVPHQVSMKNAKPASVLSRDTNNSQQTAQMNQVETDLKGLLGIQEKKLDGQAHQHMEGELRNMLGISHKELSPDDVLKNMIGVKTHSKEEDLSDNVKLMNLIGVKPDTDESNQDVRKSASEPVLKASTNNASENLLSKNFNMDKLVSDLKIGQQSMSTSGPLPSEAANFPLTSAPSQRSEDQDRVTPSPTLSSSNVSERSGSNTPVKPILLAPSFFGPKKK